jgi:hypothetical protein
MWYSGKHKRIEALKDALTWYERTTGLRVDGEAMPDGWQENFATIALRDQAPIRTAQRGQTPPLDVREEDGVREGTSSTEGGPSSLGTVTAGVAEGQDDSRDAQVGLADVGDGEFS